MSLVLLGILNSQAAAGAAGAYEHLSTTTLTTTTSEVTLSNLDTYTDYKHLEIRMALRSDRASTDSLIMTRLNGVTTTSYNGHALIGSQNTASGISNTTQDYIRSSLRVPANSADSSNFAYYIVQLTDFLNTNKIKPIYHIGGVTDSYDEVSVGAGALQNTDAINSISFGGYLIGDSLVAGSRFAIYGIRG